MQKLPIVALAAIACTILTFSSCKKDDSPKDNLISTSCWKQVKSESRTPGTTVWTEETIDACTADDCISFSTDGILTFDEGLTKCTLSDPQTATGTFVLAEDGKTLTLSQDGFTLPFVVEELTSKKMVLTLSFIDETRTTYEAQ